MKLLLDVHAFVWWDGAKERLSPTALAACESPANTLHFSLASVWEMQIKQQLGKLTLRRPLEELLREHEEINGLQLEPVILPDILALSSLPPHHRDPFDRILVAQANRGNFHLVSRDPEIARYHLDLLW